MTSLEILNKCHLDLFPKKKTICDDVDCMRIVDQLPILNGEYIHFIGPSGKKNEDILLVTNFRVFLLMHESISFINVPIMLVESLEIKEIFYLYVYLKNAKTIRLGFGSSEKATLWMQRLSSIISKSIKLEELFAFTFYSWLTNEKSDESVLNSDSAASAAENGTRCLFSRSDKTNLVYKEFKRMKFDSNIWRLSDVNKNFELCPTYPETVILPVCMSEEQLKKIASFRSSKRFPAVVWRSKSNGAVLARSSQPNVGLLGWRMNEDELLVKAIADSSCLGNNTKAKMIDSMVDQTSDSKSVSIASAEAQLLIIDARCRSVALANRVKGGGYEYAEYYSNSEIQFMNLENIHVIRNSFHALRALCQSVNDNKTFYSQLENTKWLQHLSGIIKAACTVTDSIDRQAKSVLIHCSDGWDRTPQILSLAKLMLDPFYRTINGFRTLIEHDWLMFGHKFSQRNGHADNHTDINERCPVFLQWLDCVYQIQRQFPWAFEFNETYLLKLCYHSYSCLFGTFLCDSVIERTNNHIGERTFSVWSYLNDKNKEIINYLYDDSFDEVIYPICELVNMQLWSKLFCESEVTYLINRQELYNNQQAGNESVDSASGNSGPLVSETPVVVGSHFLLNGSTQHIDDDLDLDSNMSDLKLNSSLSLKSINTSHNTTAPLSNIMKVAGSFENTGTQLMSLKNASGAACNGKQNGSAVHSPLTAQKTRSFEDVSKSFKTTAGFDMFKEAIRKNGSVNDDAPFGCNISSDTSFLNNLSASDFPISIRSCSESNLLMDALQTITSTSPKQICHVNGSNNSSLLHNPYKLATLAKGSLSPTSKLNSTEDPNVNADKCGPVSKDQHARTGDTTSTINNSAEVKSSTHLTSVSSDIDNEPLDMVDGCHTMEASQRLTKSNGILINKINSNLIPVSNSSATSSMMRMQESTDTLVDEMAGSVHKKKLLEMCGNAIQTQTSDNGEGNEGDSMNIMEDNVFEMNVPKSEMNCSRTRDTKPTEIIPIAASLVKQNSSEASSTPLSSSIPSPDSSMVALMNKQQNQSNCNSILINNTVSTSTSGLCDYITSNKVCYINDKIKNFEQNFHQEHNQNDIYRPESSSSVEIIGSASIDSTTATGLASENQRLSRLKSTDKTNGIVNGGHGSGAGSSANGKRIASKSIPIVRKNGVEQQKSKKKKKTIQDCIDIDGLTKIEDKTCRKIVERDDQYRKELTSLKNQVNKYKSFLNTLTTNGMWHDNSSLKNHEMLLGNGDRSQSGDLDNIQSNSYSFSNDSMCSSSWDEIDESDYKTAQWVPDFYVTHCQGCNNKFSYRLRKHHCRNCGQVFCYQCADQFAPLPNHNLTAPARVCKNCMLSIDEKKRAMKSASNTTVSNNHNLSSHSNHNNPEMRRSNHNGNELYSSSLSFSSIGSGSGSSFLSNPIKYDPTTNKNSNQNKKILVQNQQGFYINALGNSGTQTQQHQCQSMNGGSPLLNKSCNHHESSGNEFIEQNGNKTQKVSV